MLNGTLPLPLSRLFRSSCFFPFSFHFLCVSANHSCGIHDPEVPARLQLPHQIRPLRVVSERKRFTFTTLLLSRDQSGLGFSGACIASLPLPRLGGSSVVARACAFINQQQKEAEVPLVSFIRARPMLQIGGIPWVLPGVLFKSDAILFKQPSFSPLNQRNNLSKLGHQQQRAKRGFPCFASVAGPTVSTEVAGNMGRPFPPISTLKAVLFDVDGTLTDSDPLHYVAFRDMLQQEGYNGGEPITEEFFSDHISGKFNADIGRFLFPDWEESRQTKWLDDKEALFRKLAADRLEGKPGLTQFTEWIKKKNLRRAAVTNAPRLNAEQMIASCGLKDFFEYLIIGSECERGKPFPDPYLKALKLLGMPASEAVVFEDSVSGTTAAVDAELPVVGVISGNPESTLLRAGVAFTIKDFSDPALWSALGEAAPL